jgi:multicomponent Na+:H+ antiporter subunit C
MNLLFATVIGILFGAGVFLLLKPDLFRVVAGLVLISNAANLTLMASGLTRGEAPIEPGTEATIADPLVQAMTLTAIVIGFAVTAVLLALCFGVYRTGRSVDLDELQRRQAAEAAEQEAGEEQHDEELEPPIEEEQEQTFDEAIR